MLDIVNHYQMPEASTGDAKSGVYMRHNANIELFVNSSFLIMDRVDHNLRRHYKYSFMRVNTQPHGTKHISPFPAFKHVGRYWQRHCEHSRLSLS